MWTLFWDMHSGGTTKFKPYEQIYVEAPQELAESVFVTRTGQNPNWVACSCCGENYSVSEHESLDNATSFHRSGYTHGSYKREEMKTILEYIQQPEVLVIRADSFTEEEKSAARPKSGRFVWVED